MRTKKIRNLRTNQKGTVEAKKNKKNTDAIVQLSRKKELFIESFLRTFGNVTQACQGINIARQTYYDWLNNDPDFKTKIESSETEERFLDFLEAKLASQINNDNTTALIFALKYKGSKRGYIERREQDVSGDVKITFVEEIIRPDGDTK